MNKNEIDIKLNLLEVIKELPSIIAENVYVTVGFISNRFNVNHIEATYILNSFIIESANIDDKYSNLYDNYQNITPIQPELQDFRYTNNGFGGYFGKNGIYQ